MKEAIFLFLLFTFVSGVVIWTDATGRTKDAKFSAECSAQTCATGVPRVIATSRHTTICLCVQLPEKP